MEFRWFQQGDICCKPVEEMPINARKLRGAVLARGEATGHAHVAIGEGVRLLEHKSNIYMIAPHGAKIVHEEHLPVNVPSGTYLISIVREFDHFTERAREVKD